MNLDEKIIQAYQWIVDTTEKKPMQLAEPATLIYFFGECMARILNWESGADTMFIGLAIILTSGMLYATRVESYFKMLGDSLWIRPMFFGLVIANAAVVLVHPTGRGFLFLISGLGMFSFYGFAGCEGPRPKKRKEKLVLNPI